MLFEIGLGITTFSAVSLVAASPKLKLNDRRKIERIFKNLDIGVREDGKAKYPKFVRKTDIQREDGQAVGTRYIYSLPLGISGKKISILEKEAQVFREGLKKPVITDCEEGYLHVKVFFEDIPNLYEYKHLPSNKKKWTIPIGVTQEKLIWHNFDHTPHMTVAGTTRFGKTVLLKLIMTYLIEQHSEDVELYIIDLKGGLEFDRYRNVKQVQKVASNPMEAFELLEKLYSNLEHDLINFKKNGWANVVDTTLKKRRFIIVDEAAQLAPDKSMSKEEKQILGSCQAALSEVARVAGALGYRLVFATQYPTADTLPRQIKQNADAKITFRLPAGYASQVAIDDYGAEELPSDVKGRALFKTHELREMQVPYISDKEMKKRLERFEEDVIIECSEEESETGTYFRELD